MSIQSKNRGTGVKKTLQVVETQIYNQKAHDLQQECLSLLFQVIDFLNATSVRKKGKNSAAYC